MAQLVLDVVVRLPDELRSRALTLSARLDDEMRALGCASHFRLGEPYPGHGGGPCEPHISLFMLTVEESEVGDVLRAAERAGQGLPAVRAEGERYRHNPQGAPGLYFRKTPEWIDLQHAVITEVEPLRRGRLRELDPAGARIRDLLADPGLDPARRRQFAAFGYDQVTQTWDPAGTGEDDRFNPHTTLGWPTDPACRVGLDDLPPPATFSGTLSELAVYGMSPHGTCTARFGTVRLGRPPAPDADRGSPRPDHPEATAP